MEFLLYLTPVNQEIYNMISNKIRVVENAPICRQQDIYGWYNVSSKTMIICTDRIKENSNGKYYLNETLLHESGHVAQSCKNNMGNLLPLGIPDSLMKLDGRRSGDLSKTTRIYGSKNYKIEKEAFWLEDKPDKVKYAIKRFCF
jgi:hypothetical protein